MNLPQSSGNREKKNDGGEVMSVYKVEICGVNTSRLPLLKNEEKEALFQRIRNGDEEARQEYIKGNLRLVLSVIQRFSGHGDNMDDLFQIGCIGLIKAIDNFDLTQNVRFSTYAVPMKIGGRKEAELSFQIYLVSFFSYVIIVPGYFAPAYFLNCYGKVFMRK